MKIIIVGCGKVGMTLAEELDNEGHDITIIDQDSVVVEKVKSLPAGEGLNCANGEYGNMIEMGVNDPVKVTRTALQSAASVAALILITEATINEIPKEGPDLSALASAMGGGGGMY